MSAIGEESYDVICFLAREAGFRCLAALVDDPRFRVKLLYTHRKKPSGEDPQRSEREDFPRFRDLAAKHAVPVQVKDTYKQAGDFSELADYRPFDLIISCSWRFLVPLQVLQEARIGAINLHRGKLPEYAGAEPVKRALADGRNRIVLSAHVMEKEYDSGEVLAEEIIPGDIHPGETIDDAVQRLKQQLLPHYPRAMFRAVDVLLNRST